MDESNPLPYLPPEQQDPQHNTTNQNQVMLCYYILYMHYMLILAHVTFAVINNTQNVYFMALFNVNLFPRQLYPI